MRSMSHLVMLPAFMRRTPSTACARNRRFSANRWRIFMSRVTSTNKIDGIRMHRSGRAAT